MNKNQVVEILSLIETYYPGKLKSEDPDKVVKAWHEVLKPYEFDEVKKNLIEHVRRNKFLPTIADLIVVKEKGHYVPSVEETRKYLDELDKRKEEAEQRVPLGPPTELKEFIEKLIKHRGETSGSDGEGTSL